MCKLSSITLGLDACRWFDNYLKDRSQAVRVDGIQSKPLELVKGVPQGSILGPLLFTLYIINIGDEIRKCQIHLYTDDTVMYCIASTADHALSLLETYFKTLQVYFIQLKLDAKKTHFMISIGSKSWLKIHLHLRA